MRLGDEQVGLIHLLPQRWDTVWLDRHRIVTGLSRTFPSIWMEPARHWRESLRSFASSRLWKPDPVAWPNLTVYRHGWLLGKIESIPTLDALADRARLRACRQELLNQGCERIVLVLWRPQFFRAPDLIPHDLCCYYINDEYSFDLENEVTVSAQEETVLRRADVVFIHSRMLFRKKGGLNPNSFWVPNGVNFKSFSTPVPEPGDLRGIPRPRVGYVGHLKRQLDWDLIRKLVVRHADWSFVFVGPVSPHPEVHETIQELKPSPNTHFMGLRKHEELPGYVQHFDVCTMPYIRVPYTDAIYPLKLHEYLATGRPVVSTGIESVQEFSDVVEIANGPDEWSAALTSAIREEPRDRELVRERRAVAKQFDWSILVGRISDRIRDALRDRGHPSQS